MLSNPCSWFKGGGSSKNEQHYIIHDRGDKLFHFCPYNCGLTDSYNVNIIFFAYDKKHAASIIEKMLQFRLTCNDNLSGEDGKKLAQFLLDNKDKWKITPAPMNQFYSVGWAANDSIL